MNKEMFYLSLMLFLLVCAAIFFLMSHARYVKQGHRNWSALIMAVLCLLAYFCLMIPLINL